MGGKYHLKLNIGTSPIANKYREGKMKSTLKRELKACETVKREAIEVSSAAGAISRTGGASGSASPVSLPSDGVLVLVASQHHFWARETGARKVASVLQPGLFAASGSEGSQTDLLCAFSVAARAVGLHVVRWRFGRSQRGVFDTQSSDVDEMALTDPS